MYFFIGIASYFNMGARPVLYFKIGIQTCFILPYGNQASFIRPYGNQAGFLLHHGSMRVSKFPMGTNLACFLMQPMQVIMLGQWSWEPRFVT